MTPHPATIYPAGSTRRSKLVPTFTDWRFYVRTDSPPMGRWFYGLCEGGPGDGGVRALAANYIDFRDGIETFDDVDRTGESVSGSSVIGWSHDKAAVETAWLAYLVSEGWAETTEEARALAGAGQ